MTSEPPQQTQQTHNNNFDALRLLAAVAVLWAHQYWLTGRTPPATSVGDAGYLGVLAFFAISGFLVLVSWQREPELWPFLRKRLLRVWPALAVATCWMACVLGPMVTQLDPVAYFTSPDLPRFFKIFYFDVLKPLPGVFKELPYAGVVNGSLWTIPIEIKCYLLIGGLGTLGLLRGTRRAGLSLAAVGVFIVWVQQDLLRPTHPARPFGAEFTLAFIAGGLMAVSLIRWHRHATVLAIGLTSASLGCILLAQPLAAALLGLPGLVVLAGNASTPGIRSLGRYGDFSYGIYIYAFPVQQTLVQFGAAGWPVELAFAASLACTLPLAMASWYWVERPALTLKARKSPALMRRKKPPVN